ncbi:MAG: hypothetical protein BIFFINMI_03405 [Phycisphaerae bacterium]|nr:hypothetical protein [Phycisphaerae bacterium]
MLPCRDIPTPIVVGAGSSCLGIVRALGETGLRCILVDAGGGPAASSRYAVRRVRLLEINPRCGLPIYATVAAGVNVPWLAVADAAGVELPPPCVVLDAPLIWLRFTTELDLLLGWMIGRGGSSPRAWRRPLQGRRVVCADFNAADPASAASTALYHLCGCAARWFRRLSARRREKR